MTLSVPLALREQEILGSTGLVQRCERTVNAERQRLDANALRLSTVCDLVQYRTATIAPKHANRRLASNSAHTSAAFLLRDQLP